MSTPETGLRPFAIEHPYRQAAKPRAERLELCAAPRAKGEIQSRFSCRKFGEPTAEDARCPDEEDALISHRGTARAG